MEIDRENKKFHDETRFEQYVFTNPTLLKVLEGKNQPKEVSGTHKKTSNR